jgi:serine/threonine protein kinase
MAADVYSFGCIMLEMLTWQPPYGPKDMMRVRPDGIE